MSLCFFDFRAPHIFEYLTKTGLKKLGYKFKKDEDNIGEKAPPPSIDNYLRYCEKEEEKVGEIILPF